MVNVTLKTAKEHLQNVPSTGVHSLTVLGAVVLHSSAMHEQQTHKIRSKPINEKRHKIFQDRRSSKLASQHHSCCSSLDVGTALQSSTYVLLQTASAQADTFGAN
jgi:hypothetical protein